MFRYREEELASKDREIASLEKQLHSYEQELAGISKARETTIRENKRILDDLTLMTEDNQVYPQKSLIYNTDLMFIQFIQLIELCVLILV